MAEGVGIVILHYVLREVQVWERFKKTGDDFYLDSVALNLHSFYTAIEKIFEMIADAVDQSKPSFSSEDSSTKRSINIMIGS